FDTVDAAQKCIDVLRSHHNLHPTFAKRTPTLSPNPTNTPSFSFINSKPTNRALAAPHQHNEPASVRRRLRPRTLAREFYLVSASWPWLVDFDFVYWDADGYWWRLPMNINVPTLRVLVAPHVIRGSRFFADTRLQPPQLVAYIQCVFLTPLFFESFVGALSLPISSLHSVAFFLSLMFHLFQCLRCMS
ncbi:hypothetical protein M422DRAFT_276551, partial [Sphaerobolus stellatus SS14]